MPVLTTARILELTDKKLWRIVLHYVKTVMTKLDLSTLKAFALDETKARKGHRHDVVVSVCARHLDWALAAHRHPPMAAVIRSQAMSASILSLSLSWLDGSCW